VVAKRAHLEAQLQCLGAASQRHGRQRLGAAIAVQQHRDAQDQRQVGGARIPGGLQVRHCRRREPAPMRANQACQQQLFLAREPRHVRVFQQVGAMAVIAAVRDIQADLVQPAGPGQCQLRQGIVQLPAVLYLFQ
jgi:hypothetical protein